MAFHYEAIGQMALSQFWQLTAVICVAGLLTLLVSRRRPHLAYVFWLIVLLKAVTPPIWSSPTSVFSWTGATVAKSAETTAPAIAPASSEPASDGSAIAAEQSTSPADDSRHESAATAANAGPNQAVKSADTLGVEAVLGIVWLGGAAALAGLLIGRWSYYFVLLRHHRVDSDDRMLELVDELSRRLGVRRRVEVLVTTRPFGPAVGGLWRPTLILPEALLRQESREHIERIVAHELIHIRRGDNLVGVLQLVAQIVWWFHPLVWWTNRRMCVAREHCCDEQVVASLRCDPGKYAQSLLDMLKLRRQLRPALLPGVDAPEVTKKRLENIMDRGKVFRRRMPGVCWAMLLVGILVVVPGAGFTLADGPAEKAGAPETGEPLGLAMPEPIHEIALVEGDDLQKAIDDAKPGAVITVAPGTYDAPLSIDKPITLQGQSAGECILEVAADEPAVMITSKKPVKIESLTIRWERATSGRPSGPTGAVVAKDSKVKISGCRIEAPTGPARSPSAVNCDGFSDVNIENCRVEGFEYCINFSGGARGKVSDCVVLNPGHCGITVYTNSQMEVARCIVTGSRFHALRSTGGKINAHDNLIIKNKNRGIYLGNRPARGTIRNNVIMSAGAGISAFPGTDTKILNNLFIGCDFAGLAAADAAPVTVKGNLFVDNPKGLVVFKQSGRYKVNVQKNAFWKNKEDTENVKPPKGGLLVADPEFKNPEQGDFTPQNKDIIKAKQGLTDPSVFVELWKKWEALSQE